MMPRDFTISSLEFCLSQLKKADESVVKKAISSGDGLTESTSEVNNRLSEAHKFAVNQCLDNSEKLASLHHQIIACDNVFERLERTLIGFQNNLGSIGEDMKNLQLQSHDIHQELENRQKVRKELSQFVDDIVVPQPMIDTIMESDANERGFIEALHELHHKINLISTRGDGDAISVNDTWPTVERLKTKATEKVREWLLTKIGSFRKPLSNYQIFQHQLLKFRFFYEFLFCHEPDMAKEVQEEYIEATSKMFFSYFRAYAARLFRLSMKDVATKDDLLGHVDSSKSGLTSLFSSMKQPVVRNKATVFSIGKRHEILNEQFLEALIVPHASTQNQQSYQFEALFRSFQLAFVDHYSHEFMFVCDFFLVANAEAAELHARAMARAASVVLKTCEEQIVLNWDAISLHLCICLTSKFHAIIKEREVPDVAGYWENLKDILFTRLDQVMAAHNESIRTVDLKKLQHNGSLDSRPHFIIRRYAELTSSHLTIAKTSQEPIHDEMQAILVNSEDSMEQLLTRMSAMQQTQPDKHVFLINNYDLILGIIDDGESNHNRIHALVHELQQKSINDFAEVILDPHIGYMIKFIHDCEGLMSQGHTQLLERHNERIPNVVKSFNEKWRPSIDIINTQVIKYFTNLRLGSHIIQIIFSKLVQYIQQFTKLLTHEVFASNPACRELVNVHQVMSEIKKCKSNY